jgi:hypothetical protein
MRPFCVRPGRSRHVQRERPDTFLLVKAEGVGFEPTVTLPPQWFSRASVFRGLPPGLPALSAVVDSMPSKIIPRISRV